MSATEILGLIASAIAAGAINAVAGGGTLIGFPALVAAGYPAKVANVTNTIALWPGALGSSTHTVTVETSYGDIHLGPAES